jgi:hypothetical protein
VGRSARKEQGSALIRKWWRGQFTLKNVLPIFGVVLLLNVIEAAYGEMPFLQDFLFITGFFLVTRGWED